jgi:hypothetical protein
MDNYEIWEVDSYLFNKKNPTFNIHEYEFQTCDSIAGGEHPLTAFIISAKTCSPYIWLWLLFLLKWSSLPLLFFG